MPRLTSEAFGGGDQSWLGSSHSIANCRTETLDISAFTKATHYPDGYIPSGTPVCKTGGVLVPLTGDNAADFAGHVYTDQTVAGAADLPVPVFYHGTVKTARVPGDFTAPTAQPHTTIVYI